METTDNIGKSINELIAQKKIYNTAKLDSLIKLAEADHTVKLAGLNARNNMLLSKLAIQKSLGGLTGLGGFGGLGLGSLLGFGKRRKGRRGYRRRKYSYRRRRL